MPKPLEIKRIAAIALGSIDAILTHWLPGGRREGKEYLVRNPRRGDDSPGSFSVNTASGRWSDFATGDRGLDVISLIAFLENETQGQACQRLATFLGIELEEKPTPKRTPINSNVSGNGKPLTDGKEINSAPVSPVLDGDGWRCAVPIPDGAPPPPKTHSRYGGPSKIYEYCAADGRLNFYHWRFEPKSPDQRKQFSPVSLWVKDGRYEWKFKAPPEPRPLYGLPSLMQYPDAEVWLCEGEKAAEALQKLLPNHPVLCWQGGAAAVEKSDYTPLVGRDCRVWPDNDNAGLKAAGKLRELLQAAGASSIQVLNIAKLEREPGVPLQPGDDAHDLLDCDWDAARFSEFLRRDDGFISVAKVDESKPIGNQQEPPAESACRGFELHEDGLFFWEQTKDGRFRRRKVCARLEVLALARDADSREWGTLVRFSDPDGNIKQLIIPARSFNGDGLEASGRLLSEGLTIAPKSRQLVIEYLQTQTPEKRARTTNRIGWHGSGDDLAFVLPDHSIGSSSDEWLYSDNRPDTNPFKNRGTLQQWQNHVAVLCTGNSRLTFAVSIAFAVPLLHLIEMESGGFHYRGSSSSGKTSALFVAGSVCGSPEYLQRWRSTDNALESTALAHCDALLTLDELKMVDARIAAESAYLLANGCSKARANLNGGLRNTAKWRLLFLSAGELSLSQHVSAVGKITHSGAEIRMADIPADAGQGLGCFEHLHSFENGHEFAKALGSAVNKYYGTPFPAFIERLLKEPRDGLRDSLFAARQQFEKATLSPAAGGQQQRVAARFALVGAAGELATDWGITGWPPGEAMQAAITCFKAWLQSYGGEGNREEKAMIEQVRHFLELHGEARFTDIDRSVVDDSHSPKTLNRAGFRQRDGQGALEYYCYPEVFKAEICKGFDYRAVARLLIGKGYMRGGEDRNLQVKVRLPGDGQRRVFHILPTIWGDQDE